MCRVFANGSRDRGSIQGRHTKDSKMVLDAALLSSQHYQVRIKWRNPLNGVMSSPPVVAIKKWTFRSPSTKVANFTLYIYIYIYIYIYMCVCVCVCVCMLFLWTHSAGVAEYPDRISAEE